MPRLIPGPSKEYKSNGFGGHTVWSIGYSMYSKSRRPGLGAEHARNTVFVRLYRKYLFFSFPIPVFVLPMANTGHGTTTRPQYARSYETYNGTRGIRIVLVPADRTRGRRRQNLWSDEWISERCILPAAYWSLYHYSRHGAAST